MALSPNVVVVAPGDLITAAHLNNVRANLDRLDTTKLSLTGGAVTGLTSFAGSLRIARTGFTRPFVEFYNSDTFAIRQGSVIGADTGLELICDAGPIRFHPNNAEAARIDGTNALFGKAASNAGVLGVEIAHTAGRVIGTMSTASVNLLLNHIAGADTSACAFAQFQRAGTVIGSITQSGTTAVLYNTTSDERLKTVVGPVDAAAALDKVAAMNPVQFTWNDAPGDGPQIGFLAQQLATVAPEAVTPGTGAPGDTLDEQSGEGGFVPWMTDLSRLVPTLVAAVQALTARVAELEAAAA